MNLKYCSVTGMFTTGLFHAGSKLPAAQQEIKNRPRGFPH